MNAKEAKAKSEKNRPGKVNLQIRVIEDEINNAVENGETKCCVCSNYPLEISPEVCKYFTDSDYKINAQPGWTCKTAYHVSWD